MQANDCDLFTYWNNFDSVLKEVQQNGLAL
jgi:hypothetical protein